MVQYSRIEVANVMKETGMPPLFYHPDIALGKKVKNMQIGHIHMKVADINPLLDFYYKL